MIMSLNSINELIVVMVKCGVLFEVRTEFLNIIYTSFGFRGLIWSASLSTVEQQCNLILGQLNTFLCNNEARYMSCLPPRKNTTMRQDMDGA
jgi:hypothetical protein